MKYQVTTRHGQMILPYANDYIAQQLISNGEYEWYVVDIIKQLSQGHDTGIILDIGANIGTMCLPLARDFPNYQIHAFEIQPRLLKTIKENIQLNGLTNIVLYEHGLGNIVDIISIRQPVYDSATNIGALSLNPLVWEHSDISVGHGDAIDINVVPLDSIKFDIPIRCIKLDVEGYERLVIEGAVETLKQHNYPPIVYELWGYNAWWKEEAKKLKDLLIQLGYTDFKQIDDTGIAIRP